MTPIDKQKWLLPDSFRKGSVLLWLMILPQLLLLALNLRAWGLVSGEMSQQQRGMSLTLFSYECALLIFGLVSYAFLRRRKKNIGWILSISMLLVHIGYLWLCTAWLTDILPESVTTWIMPPTQFLYYQYALMMPALFYAGLRISCFNLPLKRASDVGLSLVVLVFVPVTWFVLLQLSFALTRWAEPPFFLLMLFMVGSTVIMLVAFLRILLFVYARLRHVRSGWWILLLCAGLLAPIGGLLLNRSIPFPYDFQDPFIYGFAVLNGIILLLPFRLDSPAGRTSWVLRAVMYPFTVYFFIVFLPFIPLSLLAMIACGAGFLILAPILLFIIHTRKLLDEGRQLVQKSGPVRTAGLFILSILLIPLAYTGRALLDKHALMQAVDAVYSPDYTEGQVKIDPAAARRSLLRLRDMKEGIYLPFLSDYYNSLVFDGMVLPDYKMQKISKALLGEEMPDEGIGNLWGDIFSSQRRGRNAWTQRARPPSRNVNLDSIEVQTSTEHEVTRTMVELTLRNAGPSDSEFVTNIEIPEGVLVSGYWLKVEGEKVPGRIFEKKTAMWVYHMIRDASRRDPGLLVFENDSRLKLSVYPFNRDQVRITSLEFQFPVGLAPGLRIGDKTVALGASSETQIDTPYKVRNKSGATWLILSEAAATSLPATDREPYLHFIIDRSAKAREMDTGLAGKINSMVENFPAASQARITLANYEFRHITPHPVPVSEAAKSLIVLPEETLPPRGGFCAERAIKSALLDSQNNPSLGKDGHPLVPVFVVIPAPGSEIIREDQLATFADIAPDTPEYYLFSGEGKFEAHALRTEKVRTVTHLQAPLPAVVFRGDDTTGICLANSGGLVWLGPSDTDRVEIYDPGQGGFSPLPDAPLALNETSKYAKGLALWQDYREAVFHPPALNDRLPRIVNKSRSTGILTPFTSYIVVENSAQWEMLKRKEKQALGADQALEFDEFMESPTPSTVYFIPVLLLFLCFYHRRTKSRNDCPFSS